jgi:hypothetical protein
MGKEVVDWWNFCMRWRLFWDVIEYSPNKNHWKA